MTDTGLELGPNTLGASVEEFAGQNGEYYTKEFSKIQSTTGFPWSWNTMAALLGPLWGAARGAWGFFWVFMVLELFALVQLGRGLWGDLGADQIARYERLTNLYQDRYQKAQEALQTDQESAQSLLQTAGNLKKAAEIALEKAELAAAGATTLLLVGIALIVVIKVIEGFYANLAYEKQYVHWRADPKTASGLNNASGLFGGFLLLGVVPLTLFRFTVANPDKSFGKLTQSLFGTPMGITEFPMKNELFTPVSNSLEGGFDWLSANFGEFFKGITNSIRFVLDGLEVILVQTPWPVVMLVIIVTAGRMAGARVAIFTGAAVTYLALLGLWEVAMVTVALLGAAAFLCILFGIPLGIWFGKSQRAYNAALPVLDLMQTLPAFVYLIPIIAFFGTGKPPGVIATIIFGMPPVIRLTALGMRGVPETTKEAARAFGCTKWQLLRNVELPLAMPSIMTGINQTTLMCLSMVVIAALIGAGGLGKNILEALQYAAKGQGMVYGLAILFCAMVIDRAVQGRFARARMK